MARLITASFAMTIPSLQGLDDPGRLQLLADADAVLGYVATHEQTTEADLRAYWESNGIGPDRATHALALLRETGQLLSLPDSPPLG